MYQPLLENIQGIQKVFNINEERKKCIIAINRFYSKEDK